MIKQKESPRLVSPSTMARKIGVHPETIRRWIDSNKVKAGRTPTGRIKISIVEVYRIIEEIGLDNDK